jgi:uncharacterized protein with FMN-binding domain
MQRVVMWFLSTVTALVLLFGYHTSTEGAATAGDQVVISSGTAAGTGSSTSGTSPSGSRSGQTESRGTNGSSTTTPAQPKVWTGSTAQTQYGPVQVQIATAAGTITKVSVLQYPSGDPQDDQISGYALPILVQETVDTQGANIDMVSGATYTSDGYLQSLQSALDQSGL